METVRLAALKDIESEWSETDEECSIGMSFAEDLNNDKSIDNYEGGDPKIPNIPSGVSSIKGTRSDKIYYIIVSGHMPKTL